MRREVLGHVRPGERLRFVRAYDALVSEAATDPKRAMDSGYLHEIHDAAVGTGDLRTIDLHVSGGHRFPPPSAVPEMIEDLFDSVIINDEPPSLAAARLHLGLLTIHPFKDGNGRTARLVGTLCLVRAGWRSSLLTGVEQHFHSDPLSYVVLLDQFRYREISEEECLVGLMKAMMSNSMYAAWFTERESRLRVLCAARCIPASMWMGVVSDFDACLALGDLAIPLLVNGTFGNKLSLGLLASSWSPSQRTEFAIQVERLLDEESSPGA
jgi:hypothetical protein